MTILLQAEVDMVASEWRMSPDKHAFHGRNCECVRGKGAGNWPLRPSRVWPGENALTCPVCVSEHVIMSSLGEFIGNRWVQTGSSRSLRKMECRHCGHTEVN